jgi:hypothetical protein
MIKGMARGMLSLFLLIGLLFVAFVLREFTPPWGVGKKLEEHGGKISELQDGVAKNEGHSMMNEKAIEENKKAIAENRNAIEKNRKGIQSTQAGLKDIAKDQERRSSELRELKKTTEEMKDLHERSLQIRGDLEREVLRLKKSGRILESRLSAIERKLGIEAPGPEMCSCFYAPNMLLQLPEKDG